MKLGRVSVFCTLLSIPTLFLIVTIFIFPMLGFFFGAKAYRKAMKDVSHPNRWDKVRAAFPMGFAVLIFALELVIVNSTYRP